MKIFSANTTSCKKLASAPRSIWNCNPLFSEEEDLLLLVVGLDDSDGSLMPQVSVNRPDLRRVSFPTLPLGKRDANDGGWVPVCCLFESSIMIASLGLSLGLLEVLEEEGCWLVKLGSRLMMVAIWSSF